MSFSFYSQEKAGNSVKTPKIREFENAPEGKSVWMSDPNNFEGQ